MKILLFGRGVISTQYGWVFEKAGHTVEFYVRPGKKEKLGSKVHLQLFDARKKIRGVLVNETWNIKLTEEINPKSDYDLIIVSVQHYHFKSVVDLLAGKIGKATILLFNNFWDEPKDAVAKLPQNQLVWGFPGAGGGFDNNGILNGSLQGFIKIGTFGTEQTQRGIEVMNTFKTAGIKVIENKDFRSYLFSHFVSNAALHLETLKLANGLASLDDFKTPKFWTNVFLNYKDLLPLLKARNVDLKASSELKLFSLPPFIISCIFRILLKFVPPMKQLFTGHSNKLELISYCQDVVAKAKELKIELPRFEENKELFVNAIKQQ
jgi:2-dehydropantoate 2-reductase